MKLMIFHQDLNHHLNLLVVNLILQLEEIVLMEIALPILNSIYIKNINYFLNLNLPGLKNLKLFKLFIMS